MEQRSTLCTNQMFALHSEPSNTLIYPDHHFISGNASDYANRNGHPVLALPVNTMNVAHQFRDYPERLMFYGNEYNTVPNCQAMQSLSLGVAGSNFHNSNMLLTPSGRNFPVGQSNVRAEQPLSINQTDNGINMDELNWHNQIFGSDMSSKGKFFDMIRGSFHNLNDSASSSSSTSYNSLNSGIQHWGQSFEPLPQMMDANFCPPEYEGRASLPGSERSHLMGQSRSVSASNLQPEFAFLPHQNCLLPVSYMMQPFHPANNAWVSQFANGNNISDSNSGWNQKNPVIYLQGRCQNSGPFEMGNISMQAYTGSSCGPHSALLFHHPSMPNFHPPVQNLHVQSYRSHGHTPASSQHAINNLRSITSGDGPDARVFYPHYPSATGQIFRSRQLPQPARHFNNANLRLMPAEAAALANLSRFDGVRNALDQHHDMRLNIDDMSYEDLLALEERIGIVKTGLSDEFIVENLKTRIYPFVEAALTSEPSSRQSTENEGCAICQVDYEDNEVTGTLDCGHYYHAHCIKQWLLIKNLCPICKITALSPKDMGELK